MEISFIDVFIEWQFLTPAKYTNKFSVNANNDKIEGSRTYARRISHLAQFRLNCAHKYDLPDQERSNFVCVDTKWESNKDFDVLPFHTKDGNWNLIMNTARVHQH